MKPLTTKLLAVVIGMSLIGAEASACERSRHCTGQPAPTQTRPNPPVTTPNPFTPGPQVGQLTDNDIDFDLPTKRLQNTAAKPAASRGKNSNATRVVVVHSR